jgi:hypothetical protein
VAPAYFTAAVFIISATVDIITAALPFNPSAIAWRFGIVGGMSNNMLTAFFGVAMACGTAIYYGHRTAMRVFAVTCVVLSIVLVLVLGDFGLSVAQLRGQVPATERGLFAIGTAKAALKYLMNIIGFIVLAMACWKGARRTA